MADSTNEAAAVEAAMKAIETYWSDPALVSKCETCGGRGWVSAGPHDQDWCSNCCGGTVNSGTDEGAIRAAIAAHAAALAGEAVIYIADFEPGDYDSTHSAYQLLPGHKVPAGCTAFYTHPTSAPDVAANGLRAVGWFNQIGDRLAFFEGDLNPRDVHDNGKPVCRAYISLQEKRDE